MANAFDKLEIDLPQKVGKGYATFWNFQGRYLVCKGGRGSKKSCTAAIRFVYLMMKYYHVYGESPNLMVVRRYFNTHRDSTFAQLVWAIKHLGVEHLWKIPLSAVYLQYKPSGQTIMFRGMDDPQSITSITTSTGHLCWVWWEEAFQITSEEAFNKIDLSIRGEIPDVLFKQHVFTFNPWSDKIWIKSRFFDADGVDVEGGDPNILTMTTNYLQNEFLGEDDRDLFARMKIDNPRRFNIEGMGAWGISTGLIYENVEIRDFDWHSMLTACDKYDKPLYKLRYGLDFGYTNDPTAFIGLIVDEKNKVIYVYVEIYKYRMTNQQIYDAIKYLDLHKVVIKADSADPRTINELRMLGLNRIQGAKKGQGSVNAGIQKLQDFKIVVHPRCTNTEVEIDNYVWKPDRITEKPTNDPIDEYNHLMDAKRYATEDIDMETFSW